MKNFEGPVAVIKSNNFRGTELYSVKLENHDEWVGWGDNKPKFTQGQYIKFTSTQNAKGYWNADVNTVEVVKPDVSSTVPAAVAATKAANNYDDRQTSIVYQSSRKDAIQLLEIAFANDAVSLPSKKADKLAALEDMVRELTESMYHDVVDFKPGARAEKVPAAGATEVASHDDE